MAKFLENSPDLWFSHFPRKLGAAHKYDYGHAAIYGAPDLTGATRLAASACARMGAGLVSVIAPRESAPVYKAALPAHIIVREDVRWDDARVTARLYGSGGMAHGVKIRLNRPCVLDADALSCMPERLNEACVLTPHEGEFEKVFPTIYHRHCEELARRSNPEGGTDGNGLLRRNLRLAMTLEASQAINAIIILKGQGTVIAHPDGRVCVNKNESAYLASAGTGDVLAGMICGLLAQRMPAFEAACAAVWMHGEAGRIIGAGLVASDIAEVLPEILKETLGIS